MVKKIKVRTLVRDCTSECNFLPEGCLVKEKALIVDGEATFCCSIIPSSWVEVLRYELERVDGEELNESELEYEQELQEALVYGSYYTDFHLAHESSTLDEHEYDSFDEAIEYHTCNHSF